MAVTTKLFNPETLRAAAKQSEGIHLVPLSLRRAIKKFLRERELAHMNRKVLLLSQSFNLIKETNLQLAASASRELVDDPMKSIDDRSGRWKIKSSYGDIGFKYQEDETVAYVASRMPSVYSACHRVLKEVRQRLPGFSPTSVLDFGAGPGSALWAMREVWPRSLERVNLVEPSKSMQRAAQSLLGNLKDLPLIHSYDSIQALNRKLEKRDRAHDLVISVKKMKLKNHYEMREYNIEILEDEEEKHAHLECRPYPDVPNASMMVVMNTERFGIAQLHQLRGRVGRGTKKSRCVFLSSTSGTLERLKAYKS